jgi:hypothetical protein
VYNQRDDKDNALAQKTLREQHRNNFKTLNLPAPPIPRTRLPRLPTASHVQQQQQQDSKPHVTKKDSNNGNVQSTRTMHSVNQTIQDAQTRRAPLPRVVYVATPQRSTDSKPSKNQLLFNQEQPTSFVTSIVSGAGPLVCAFLILAGVCSVVLCVVAATS